MKLARLLVQKLKRKPRPAEAPRLPSLVKAMRRLVSRSVLREVVASSSDRRQWSVLAAAWVGVSEAEFMREAAREMGLEFEERVPAPDLSVFRDEAREALQALRRCGCAVVLDGAAPLRFVAVDPAEVRALSAYTGKEPITVASWGEISRALDGAERIIAEAEANADLLEARHEDDLCGKIFEILVREAVQHAASAVEVISDDERTRYQFTTPDGKTGVGALRRDAAPALLRHLLRADGTARSMSGREVFVRSLGNLRNFRLSWSAQAARSDELPELSAANQAASEAQAASQATAVSLLVIDDNPMFCRVLERLLRREGFDPCFAENGAVALERLQASESFRPRAIICDLHMPLMNGRDLLQRVKSDERFSSIPVVMLTSDEDIEAEVSLLQTGAAAFLSKSKDPRVLSAQIRKLTAARNLPEAA
jgi:CheY-like chemotaxis protein